MTPLLPTYKDYTQNLIVMTSTDAKKLWRKAIKEANNYKEVQETTGTTPNPEQRKTPTTESVTNPKKQSPIGWNLREPVDIDICRAPAGALQISC